MNVEFSVIIPTKGRPALLRRALASVMRQTGVRFEVIVAEDGQGEGASAARDLLGEGAVVVRTGGLGQVQARNKAVTKACGRWVAFLDDDDWWASDDHLAQCASVLVAGAGLAFASGRIVREGDAIRDEIAFEASIDTVSIRLDNTLLVSGIAYERALHAALGPFDDNLPVYWDWDWYLRLASARIGFAATGGNGVRISTRADTVSASSNAAVRGAELAMLCDKHGLSGVVLKNHELIALQQQAAKQV